MDFDSRELRSALGHFATGVCLVTTVDSQQRAVAITVNSFSSVSLDPPLILWSLQKNSDAYDAFISSRYFAVNILSEAQQDFSDRYAKKGEHEITTDHYLPGKHGTPLIRDVLVTLECELQATHEGGDHLIFVGQVRDLQQGDGGEPLLFFAGEYRGLR